MNQPNDNRLTVAQFLAQQIDSSSKSQKQIAAEIGYECVNMVTMLKQGLTKVPLNKVGPIAQALGIDAAEFLRMVMGEYMPNTLAAVEEILKGPMLSKGEIRLIQDLRRISKDTGAEPVVVNGRDVVALVMV